MCAQTMQDRRRLGSVGHEVGEVLEPGVRQPGCCIDGLVLVMYMDTETYKVKDSSGVLLWCIAVVSLSTREETESCKVD